MLARASPQLESSLIVLTKCISSRPFASLLVAKSGPPLTVAGAPSRAEQSGPLAQWAKWRAGAKWARRAGAHLEVASASPKSVSRRFQVPGQNNEIIATIWRGRLFGEPAARFLSPPCACGRTHGGRAIELADWQLIYRRGAPNLRCFWKTSANKHCSLAAVLLHYWYHAMQSSAIQSQYKANAITAGRPHGRLSSRFARPSAAANNSLIGRQFGPLPHCSSRWPGATCCREVGRAQVKRWAPI